MVYKYLKKCSISIAIKEKQIKLLNILSHSEWQSSRKQTMTNAGGRKRECKLV
jgi:hypothetical protein